MDDKEMIACGYSIAAISMKYGPVGSSEYYDAKKRLGGDVSGECPNCGEICMGTGDCDCQEE